MAASAVSLAWVLTPIGLLLLVASVAQSLWLGAVTGACVFVSQGICLVRHYRAGR